MQGYAIAYCHPLDYDRYWSEQEGLEWRTAADHPRGQVTIISHGADLNLFAAQIDKNIRDAD